MSSILESLTKLNMCISDIRVWMIKNKLKINDSKTEFIISRSPLLKQNLSDLSVSVGNMQVSPSSKVRDLGIVFDQYLTFHEHISDICKSTHFHLRGIGRIRNLLTIDATAPQPECQTPHYNKHHHQTSPRCLTHFTTGRRGQLITHYHQTTYP